MEWEEWESGERLKVCDEKMMSPCINMFSCLKVCNMNFQ